MSSPTIIQVGLPWNHSSMNDEQQVFVRENLERSRQLMSAAGYKFSTVDVSPEIGILDYESYLRSHPVNGVCIGYGVRGSKELTPFLEQLIEATRQCAPQSKIMFNVSPDSTLDAAKRWFPLGNEGN